MPLFLHEALSSRGDAFFLLRHSGRLLCELQPSGIQESSWAALNRSNCTARELFCQAKVNLTNEKRSDACHFSSQTASGHVFCRATPFRLYTASYRLTGARPFSLIITMTFSFQANNVYQLVTCKHVGIGLCSPPSFCAPALASAIYDHFLGSRGM